MSLLSPPVWMIHIASVTEWTLAIGLVWRLGATLGRADIQRLAVAMLPHWVAGLCVLAWHATDDATTLMWIPRTHELLTLMGSVGLAVAALHLREWTRRYPRFVLAATTVATLTVGGFLLARAWLPYGGTRGAMIQSAGVAYGLFVVFLALNHRWDREAFNRQTIVGYGLLILFVVVTIALSVVARQVYRAPSLTHVDWLHGVAEGTMTVANLVLVLGLRRSLRALEGVAPLARTAPA
ncbi:MAG: DUF2499 domain-containing protein [Chloracidobacterium sp.]|uniref:DUF2499 domain-containing protein n=1 Tax=Chloracidobacterium validum TaxID=2821543 RepID=A0ABX8B9G2_9BACT|nr:DUF2499 domain-containing protein [Chloracidobacterium validum]QUW02305.1 DUF2499 domain-containing protein [Chloracidobacterium validum]